MPFSGGADFNPPQRLPVADSARLAKQEAQNNVAQYVYSMHRLGKIVPPKRHILKNISLSFFPGAKIGVLRSEEHTSELQSHRDLHSFPTRRSSDLIRIQHAPPWQNRSAKASYS